MLMKALENWRNPAVNGVYDEDPVPQITVTNFFQRICSRPITFDNAFLPGKQVFLSQRKVKYVEDIIVTRYTANLGMSRHDLIQMISVIEQASFYIQVKNHLD